MKSGGKKETGGNNPGGVERLKELFNPSGVVVNNGYPIPRISSGATNVQALRACFSSKGHSL
jgi:hypothetical protein